MRKARAEVFASSQKYSRRRDGVTSLKSAPFFIVHPAREVCTPAGFDPTLRT